VLERAGRPAGARREVVKVETNRTKLYVALISVAAALLMLAAAGWLLMTSEHEQIKGLRETVRSVEEAATVDPLDAGLEALTAGDWTEARRNFAEVAASAPPRSERAQWAAFNTALTLALSGDATAAREEWRQLSRVGLFSDRPEDNELANMFPDSADFGVRGRPVRLDDLGRYPQKGPGALVFFVAGVTDWSLGDRDEAKRLLARFLEIPPAPGVTAWDSYRRVAQRLMADG